MTTVAQSNPMKLKPVLKLKLGSASVPAPTPKPVLVAAPPPEDSPKVVPPELNAVEIAGRARSADIAATRRALLKRWPGCFRGYMRPKLPLKIGIDKDIMTAAPEFDVEIIKIVLRIYAGHPSYLDAMIEGAMRIDLNGNDTEAVTAEQAKFAAMRLGTRR
jgi:ProP effector